MASLAVTATGGLFYFNGKKSRKKYPNLVLFIVDDMRQGMMSCEGNTILHTPNVDRLAKDGHVFEDMFVTTSICPVSRASILTGQYALKHGLYDFNQPLPKDTRTFVHELKDKGYYTGFIGRWGVGTTGYEVFDSYHVDDNRTHKPNRFWAKYKNRHMHLTDSQTKRAVRFIKNAPQDRPFVLVLSYNAVHVPFAPPKRFSNLFKGVQIPAYNKGDGSKVSSLIKKSINRKLYKNYTRSPKRYSALVKDYYRLVIGIDESVGVITRKLKERKMYNNTGIVFTSDNGFMLGDHALWGKADAYDASLRVPLVVKPPANQALHSRKKGMALNIDIPATLLAMAGHKNRYRQGVSVLNGEVERKGFYFEFIKNRPTLVSCEGYRDYAYKYVRYYNKKRSDELLFDLVNDPDELSPITYMQNPTLYEKYRDLMQREKVRLSS